MRKRVAGSLPHQPAKRGSCERRGRAARARSSRATAPGPALRYLYEHQRRSRRSSRAAATERCPPRARDRSRRGTLRSCPQRGDPAQIEPLAGEEVDAARASRGRSLDPAAASSASMSSVRSAVLALPGPQRAAGPPRDRGRASARCGLDRVECRKGSAGQSIRILKRLSVGRKKLTIIRCRLTVRLFIITTSPGLAPTRRAPGLAEDLVVGVPRRPSVEVRLHRQPRPVVELLLDQPTDRSRLQAQRVAAEVDQRFAVRPAWQAEPFAARAERIVFIHAPGECFIRLEGHWKFRRARNASGHGPFSVAIRGRAVAAPPHAFGLQTLADRRSDPRRHRGTRAPYRRADAAWSTAPGRPSTR